MKTAILVDGSFFIKRYRSLYSDWSNHTSKKVARNLYAGLLRDIRLANKHNKKRELYRILYYDCQPLTKRVQNPISKRGFDFKNTDEARFRFSFHEELKKLRKVALRLGRLGDGGHWIITPAKTKELLNRKTTLDQLVEKDVRYDVRQKGVDMKIGLDIASLSYQRSVDQIILVAGDSDFVPAAKLARREGIDFILDPMWNNINTDLHEHIDGLVSGWPKRDKANKK